jgi:hypothetical protein
LLCGVSCPKDSPSKHTHFTLLVNKNNKIIMLEN